MDFDHGNGSSKYSSRHLELDDEAGSSELSSEVNGSCKHLRRRSYLELDVETGSSSNHSDTYAEVINPSGRIESNCFDVNPEIIKVWGNNNIGGTESSKRSEEIQGENHRISTETDDQFQVDIKLSKSGSGVTSISSSSLNGKHHVSGHNSYGLEECQVSSVTHETTLTQCPAVQVMDRLGEGEFDPYRFPSAVFARCKSTTPMDWSIASNESLFSIQIGSNSFSRDHIPSLKSGELFKSGEFVELSPSPVAPMVSEATLVSDDAAKYKKGQSAEEPVGEKPKHPMVSCKSSTISHHSVDNVTSVNPFAFAIRNKKKPKNCAWPSCYYSNCCWAFCYCCNCKTWCCRF